MLKIRRLRGEESGGGGGGWEPGGRQRVTLLKRTSITTSGILQFWTRKVRLRVGGERAFSYCPRYKLSIISQCVPWSEGVLLMKLGGFSTAWLHCTLGA